MRAKPEPFAPELPGVLFTAVDLAGKPVPERQWLVSEMIPAGKVTLLSGDGGTGKSLIALQLCVAVVTGRHWLGLQPASGCALFVTAEDDKDEVHRRLHHIVAAEGLDLGEVENLTILSLAGRDALLATPGPDGLLHPTSLFAGLQTRLVQHPVTLLVLDTLADLFGGNENARSEARQFVQLLVGLALHCECTVLLLAHPSLSGLASGSGTSGSTAWNNSVRSRLYLDKVKSSDAEPDADARVLRVMKSNYGPVDKELSIRWQQGVFVPDARDGKTLDRMARGQKAERVFLKLVLQFEQEGRYVSPNPGPTFAPTTFAKHVGSEGCTSRVLRDAMDKLLSVGKVRVETHGRAGRERRHIVAITAGAH